jgi:hypothetical protein
MGYLRFFSLHKLYILPKYGCQWPQVSNDTAPTHFVAGINDTAAASLSLIPSVLLKTRISLKSKNQGLRGN